MPRFCVNALMVVCLLFGSKRLLCAQEHLDFGPVRLGGIQTDTLQIYNTNLVDMLVTHVSVTDSVFCLPAAPFSGALSVVPPGEARVVAIQFKPSNIGHYAGELHIQSDPILPDIHLTGEGVRSVIEINEILADPASGEEGDANGDGVRNSNEDEFVEIINTGNYPILIEGWQLSDAKTTISKRFSFPPQTWIEAGERVVLFGGGNPLESLGKVFVDDGRIGGGFSNSGDNVYLFSADGLDTLAQASYGSEGGKDQSLVRFPEGLGNWGLHKEFPGNGASFSPGKERVVLAGLEVFPRDTMIAWGDTLQVSVVGVYTDGSQASVDSYVTWTVSDSLILESLSEGEWEGVGSGETVIVAEIDSKFRQEVHVVVRPPEIVGLVITPFDTTAIVGDSVRIQVAGTLSDGSHVPAINGVTFDVDSSLVMPSGDGAFVGREPRDVTVGVSYGQVQDAIVIHWFAKGDVNTDGEVDLLDAIRTVHLILGRPPAPSVFESQSADLDRNGEIDIRDLVGIIHLIWGEPNVVAGKPSGVPIPEGIWWVEGKSIHLSSNVAVQAVMLEWQGAPLFLEDVEFHRFFINELSGKILNKGIVMGISKSGFQRLSLSFEAGKVDVETVYGTTLYGEQFVYQNIESNRVISMLPPFPNPFNPSVTIGFYLPVQQRVTLTIFTSTGQRVWRFVSNDLAIGKHQIIWDGFDSEGKPVSSGVYLGVLEGYHARETTKILLLR